MKVFLQTNSLFEPLFDKMAKWLRKLNSSPLGSACMVSNPAFVYISNLLYGEMISNLDFKSSYLILILGRT